MELTHPLAPLLRTLRLAGILETLDRTEQVAGPLDLGVSEPSARRIPTSRFVCLPGFALARAVPGVFSTRASSRRLAALLSAVEGHRPSLALPEARQLRPPGARSWRAAGTGVRSLPASSPVPRPGERSPTAPDRNATAKSGGIWCTRPGLLAVIELSGDSRCEGCMKDVMMNPRIRSAEIVRRIVASSTLLQHHVGESALIGRHLTDLESAGFA